MHKPLLIDWLTCVQNILQSSFVGPLDVVDLGICLECLLLCHHAAALLYAALKLTETRMWANAQRDGRPAEHRWRPLFDVAKFD